MAQTKTAAVIALAAAACVAAAPETDPVRRSLVVEAAQKAGPAVVNISALQVYRTEGSPLSKASMAPIAAWMPSTVR